MNMQLWYSRLFFDLVQQEIRDWVREKFQSFVRIGAVDIR